MAIGRRLRVAAVAGAGLAVLAPALPPVEAWNPGRVVPVLRDVVVEQDHRCSSNDLPETGLQGDVPRADQDSGRAKLGYNCGLSLVGHTVIERAPGVDGSRRTGNANMAWAGQCAYVAGPGSLLGPPSPQGDWGVAVVDVSDPTAPRHVTTLRTPGALATAETLHAVETPERSILVVGQYGNLPAPVGTGNVPMDVYDVSDCARPRLLETFRWPENIHNLTISGNGRYVYGTQPLQVADLEPLFDDDPTTGIRYLGNLQLDTPWPLVPLGPGADLDELLPEELRNEWTGHVATNFAHEAWSNHDGTVLYVGGVTPLFEVFTIVDISEWLDRSSGRPAGPPRLISQRSGRGHSVRTATIRAGDGSIERRLVLHSEEAVFGTAYGCLPELLNPFAGPAQPWLTDITDESEPFLVSQFGLEINEPEHCLTQLISGTNSSAHYHDVDDPDDTTFAMVSMWNAGIRIFDIRDPERPVEVAYFNPADVGAGEVVLDQAWSHIRYVRETGHLWFATASGGFWVVELAPQVRERLDLDDGGTPPPIRHPDGRPGTQGGLRVAGQLRLDPSGLYCSLGVSLTPPLPGLGDAPLGVGLPPVELPLLPLLTLRVL